MMLPDGSYEVHVISAGGEVHVLVSKAFRVTGTEQGGPGAPPAGGSQSAPGPAAGTRS